MGNTHLTKILNIWFIFICNLNVIGVIKVKLVDFTDTYNDSAIGYWLALHRGLCKQSKPIDFCSHIFSIFFMKPEWLKPKGYLHLTPSLFIHTHWERYKTQIENPSFVAKYGFYPLIHATIKERKYKKPDPRKHLGNKRSHSHTRADNGKIEKSAKERPLHYASHFDALIYAYYASILNEEYEKELKKDIDLDEAIIAYRKIKIEETEDKGKSTIHFAKEVFDEIKQRTILHKEVAVLTFDIKGFFSSLDHTFLKNKWIELVGQTEFDKHHFNVFKACTQFNYILLNDLRNRQKRNCFNETKLAKIRRENGHKCFFESNADFRRAIKEGRLSIYKNPFYIKTPNGKVNVGIPQGLPLSAVLANLYLIDFDKEIVNTFVKDEKCFYRRYSDDLILICNVDQMMRAKDAIESMIKKFSLEISKHKTEKFIFSYKSFDRKNNLRLSCAKILDEGEIRENSHLTYLGFEFRGYNTTIKSTNLSKYYRRIIGIVKRRAKRAYLSKKKNPSMSLVIYINQIKKLINKPIKIKDSDKTEIKQAKRGSNKLVPNENGTFKLIKFERGSSPKNSNYYGYVQRCASIFEDKIFLRQIRKRKKITHEAIKRHLSKYKHK